MEKESEAIYTEDNDRNLVIDDDNADKDTETYSYDETYDPNYVPEEDEQVDVAPEKQIEEIKASLGQKSLSPSDRGKKLAQLNKIRREHGIGKKKPMSMSKKSGVIFPVKRVLENFKKMLPEKIISQQAGVYLASVLEYMCSEVLDLSGQIALDVKKKRITPHFIQLSINDDEELHKLLKNTIIAQGGVTPYVHPELLVTRSRYQKRPQTEIQTEKEQISQEYKKMKMTENACQTEPLETISQQVDDASQTDITQSSEVFTPDEKISKQITPEQAKNLNISQKISSLPTRSIEQPDITSAQVAPIQVDTELELNEINSQIENITGINLEHASTPMPSEELSQIDESQSVEEQPSNKDGNIELPVFRETILETETRGNNSDKNAYINIESYLNVQTSSEKFIDQVLSSKAGLLSPVSDVTLQKILRPLENQILVTDRKIVPNVSFDRSINSRKRSRNSEN